LTIFSLAFRALFPPIFMPDSTPTVCVSAAKV